MNSYPNDLALPIVNGGASTTASGTHSPEPWPFWLRDDFRDRHVPRGWALIPEEDYERARVCVNACVGIPTEDLERWGVSLIDKIREDEMHQARQVDGTAPETSTRSAEE